MATQGSRRETVQGMMRRDGVQDGTRDARHRCRRRDATVTVTAGITDLRCSDAEGEIRRRFFFCKVLWDAVLAVFRTAWWSVLSRTRHAPEVAFAFGMHPSRVQEHSLETIQGSAL